MGGVRDAGGGWSPGRNSSGRARLRPNALRHCGPRPGPGPGPGPKLQTSPGTIRCGDHIPPPSPFLALPQQG